MTDMDDDNNFQFGFFDLGRLYYEIGQMTVFFFVVYVAIKAYEHWRK